MSGGIQLDAPSADPEPIPSPRRVGRDALATITFRVGSLPFSFAISVVTSRYLLPTGRGAFVLALLTATVASTLLGNIGVAATHELSRKEHAKNVVVAQALSLTLLVGVPATFALFFIDLELADQAFHKVAYVAFGLPAVLIVQTLSAALVAVGGLRLSNFLQFLVPVVTLVGMFGLVKGFDKGTTGAVAAWVIAQWIVALVALVGARGLWAPLRLQSLPPERIRSMAALGLRVGLVNVVSIFNYRVELIILEIDHGLAQVGLYSLATSLAELLWVVSSAIATATVAPLVAADSDQGAALLVARSARAAFMVSALLGVALGVAGWFLVTPVFGSYFASSVHPLLLLIPGAVAFAPASVMAAFFSLRQGKVRYPLSLSLFSVAITTVLAVALIPGHFGVGAAVASSAGYGLSMVVAVMWFARQSHVPLRALIPALSDFRVYTAALAGAVRR